MAVPSGVRGLVQSVVGSARRSTLGSVRGSALGSALELVVLEKQMKLKQQRSWELKLELQHSIIVFSIGLWHQTPLLSRFLLHVLERWLGVKFET